MSKHTLENLIDEAVSQIFENLSDNDAEELHVYDFDDTLVRSDSTIFVVNTVTGERKELHPHEFHEYHLDKEEQFDLSDFQRVQKPTVLPHFNKFLSDYSRVGPSGVAILTARPDDGPVRKFLKSYGVGNIDIAAIGIMNPTTDVKDANALRKKHWLKKQLDSRNIKLLSFYDDNEANIRAAQSLERDYPDVQFNIELVS